MNQHTCSLYNGYCNSGHIKPASGGSGPLHEREIPKVCPAGECTCTPTQKDMSCCLECVHITPLEANCGNLTCECHPQKGVHGDSGRVEEKDYKLQHAEIYNNGSSAQKDTNSIEDIQKKISDVSVLNLYVDVSPEKLATYLVSLEARIEDLEKKNERFIKDGI